MQTQMALGVSIGGRNITDLRYADDTALLAHDITSMQQILHRVDTEGKKASLYLNAKKEKLKSFIKLAEKMCKTKVKIPTLSLWKILSTLVLFKKKKTGSCTSRSD